MTCANFCPYIKDNSIYQNKDRLVCSIPGEFIQEIILEDGKTLKEVYPYIKDYKDYRFEFLLGEELSRYGTN